MTPALKLTLSVWVSCLLMQTIRLMGWKARLPGWTPVFFLLISLSGIGLAMLLLTIVQKSQGRFGRLRPLILGLATLLIAIAQSVTDQIIYYQVVSLYGETPVGWFDPDGITLNLNSYLWLYSLYTVALELLRMVAVAGDEARRAAEARELAHEARLQALRFQLNPHFLFNTLNAISGLMLAGSVKQAEQMIAKLSDFLRATLGKDEGALVPLIAELGIVEAYLDIESVRFGPALSVRIDCPDNLFFARVPVFILQPLVENAVKYAIAPSEDGGRVTIRVRSEGERLLICVIDRGADAQGQALAESTGVGLNNTRARLAALYDGDALLETEAGDRGFTAKLDLPLQIEPAMVVA